MRQTQLEQPIVDGFCYDLTQLFVPGWFRAMALGQLEALRKSGLYRARWYVVPEEPTALAAYDTLEQQVHIVPGSYLWGLVAGAVGATFVPTMVRITEGSTGIPFMSDFLTGSAMGVSDANGNFFPTLLTQPRLIVAPGWVNVEIANPSGLNLAANQLQIVLFCAEPCAVLEDELQLTECAG